MVRNALRYLPVVVVLLASFAQADVMFSLGSHSGSNQEAINMSAGQTGNTIHGVTSNSFIGAVLSSSDDPLKVYSHGSSFGLQTAHDSDNPDTSVNDVTISLVTGTFQDLVGSIYGVFAQHPTVTFTVWTTDSSTPWTWSFTGNRDNDGNEDNFFTIKAANGGRITKILIEGKFYELRDLDLSGVAQPVAPVLAPESTSVTLLAAGLLGLLGRKRLH